MKICNKCKFKEICDGKLLDKEGRCWNLGKEVQSPCPVCKGILRVLVKDKWEECPCLIFHRILSYLSPLGKQKKFWLPENFTKVLAQIDSAQDLLIYHPSSNREEMFSLFAFLLLQKGLSRSYDILNLSQLIRILFQEEEEYSSLISIPVEILILTCGLNEFPNKRYPEVVLQVLDSRAFQGKHTWIYSRVSLDNLLPPVAAYVVQRKWVRLDIVSENVLPANTEKRRDVVDSTLSKIRHNVQKTMVNLGEDGRPL